jgi:hypothetical protein
MIDPRSPSNRAEFARLVETYGADAKRWPADRAHLRDMFIEGGAEADLLRDAAALDAWLDADRVKTDDAFQARLLESFKPHARRGGVVFGKWLRFAPAGALAALSALGFVAGSATAGVDDDPLYYAQAAIEAPLGEGVGLWPEEK